jgi:hypothetical protein
MVEIDPVSYFNSILAKIKYSFIGGGGGGGNACFNCGKDGHKSFECSEPKKAGGRPGGGGGGGSSTLLFS